MSLLTPKKRLSQIERSLASLCDLAPRQIVNEQFSQLVGIALTIDSLETIPAAQITRIQALSSRGETALEKYWSKTIVDAHNAWKVLRSFPYFVNYCDLTALEWEQMNTCIKHKSHQLLFIGGGPLPLTAIILAYKYNQTITVVDSCPRAIAQAKAVVDKLGLQSQISFVQSDAVTFDNYKDFNTIWVAALVGETTEKKVEIFSYLKQHLAPETHILTRSSWGGRTLLYPSLPQVVETLFTKIIEVRPVTPIINSVVILKT